MKRRPKPSALVFVLHNSFIPSSYPLHFAVCSTLNRPCAYPTTTPSTSPRKTTYTRLSSCFVFSAPSPHILLPLSPPPVRSLSPLGCSLVFSSSCRFAPARMHFPPCLLLLCNKINHPSGFLFFICPVFFYHIFFSRATLSSFSFFYSLSVVSKLYVQVVHTCPRVPTFPTGGRSIWSPVFLVINPPCTTCLLIHVSRLFC